MYVLTKFNCGKIGINPTFLKKPLLSLKPLDPNLNQSSWHSPFKWLYLSEVHDRGGEVVGPAIVALGAGVPGSPVPAQNS